MKNEKNFEVKNREINKGTENSEGKNVGISIGGFVEIPMRKSGWQSVAEKQRYFTAVRSRELQKILTAIEQTRLPSEFKRLLAEDVKGFFKDYFNKDYIEKEEYSTTLKSLDYSEIAGKKEEKIEEIMTAIEEISARIKQRFQHGIITLNYSDDNKEKKMRINTEKISEIKKAVETAIMKEKKMRIFGKEIEFNDFEEFLKETPIEKFAEIYDEISEIRRSI